MGKIYTTPCGGGITSDDVTASLSHVLNGYTALTSDSEDEVGTGTMNNRGNVTTTLNCGSSYTIPYGFHGGGGTVTANSLSSQTNANATAARILSGYTAWVNGSKLTGTMNNWGANTITLSSNTASGSAGYYSSISVNAANWLSTHKTALSVSKSGTTSWNSGYYDNGNGVEVCAYGSLTISLSLSGGTITATVSGSSGASGYRWVGSSWVDNCTTSASFSKSITGSIV